MRRPTFPIAAMLLSALIAYCPESALAADGPPEKPLTASISFGAEFSSGAQDSGSRSQSIYVPLIFTWFPTERIDAGIELPIISQRDSDQSWHLYQNNQNSTSGMMAQGGGSGAGSNSSTMNTGLGDILLRFGMIAQLEKERLPQARASLYVKCPTASKADGLGTGEFDAGAGMDAVKWFGDMQLTGELFYNYQGKAEFSDLLDYFSYTAGLGWQISTVRSMLIIRGATPPARASGNLLETRIRLLWSLTPATSIDLFVSHGIADSSPDYGAGLAVIYAY